MVFVEFQVVYECPDLTDAERSPATLTIKGDGTYDAETGVFRDHRILSETIQFRGEDAEQELRNSIIYAEGLVIGQKEVKNTIRYAIQERSG